MTVCVRSLAHARARVPRALVAAGSLGGDQSVLGNWLGLASHGAENAVDGGIPEDDAQGERGGDGDNKGEYDQQRVHVRPTFPMMQSPATLDVPPRTTPSR